MLPVWYSPIYTEGLDPGARFPLDSRTFARQPVSEQDDTSLDVRRSAEFYRKFPQACVARKIRASLTVEGRAQAFVVFAFGATQRA